MESKEIVMRAVEFNSPPRLPIHYCNRDFEFSDVWTAGAGAARGFSPTQAGQTEWGYIWTSLDETMGQPIGRPIETPEEAFTYVPPDPYSPGRFDHLTPQNVLENPRFSRFGVGISGFNQATFIRGFDDFLMDLHAEPAAAAKVLDGVFDFENGLIEGVADLPFDSVVFGDDWGTQQGLIISPELWRKVFKPRYAEQYDLIHRSGKKVWLHTCGNVYSIIGDLIDIGLDIIELLQPDVMGVENLARDFGGKVCFCCSIDHQRRAISGTRDEIFAYARLLNDTLGAFNGGFIAYIEDYRCLGMSEQNYQWIREAFHSINGEFNG
ncbi:MAG: uroporphyrinogen decarboxylase family protein [Armatimonadota bacterium]